MKINVICFSSLSQVNKLFLCESTVFGVIPGITVNDQLLEYQQYHHIFFLMYKKKMFMY